MSLETSRLQVTGVTGGPLRITGASLVNGAYELATAGGADYELQTERQTTMDNILFIPGIARTFLPSDLKSRASVYGFRQAFGGVPYSLQVKRTSDSATQDIGFSNGWIDVDALLAFCGSGSGEVVAWYDQGSRGKHLDLVKTTGPRIVNSGVLQLHDSRLAMKFNGTTDVLSKNFGLSGTDKGALICGIGSIGGADRAILQTYTETSNRGIIVLMSSSSRLRVGMTGGGLNLWDRNTLADTTRTVIGVICDRALNAADEALPFFNHNASTTGFNQAHANNLANNFDDVVGGMGALWDGGGGSLGFAGAMSFDFAAVFEGATTEIDLKTIASFFGKADEGVAIGDSTVAAFSGQLAVADYVWSNQEKARKAGIAPLAVPGHTIAQQKTAWGNFPAKLLVNWVIIEIGLNDMNPATATATTIADYQDLVDTIRSQVSATCKILLATMTPAYERWPAVGFNQADAQAKWAALNDAIMGRGSTAITGADARFEGHTIALSMDVGGNAALATAFDTGDKVHPNAAGRAIMGAEWRAALRQVGY